MLKRLRAELGQLASPTKAKILQGFFKTGRGQYGEGDIFLGITVPKQRDLVKKYWRDVNLPDLDKLLRSKIHEERLVALLILVQKFEQTNSGHSDAIRRFGSRKQIYNFYLSHTKLINNWDLVDLSADKILGAHLRNRNKSILIKLAESQNLWERRIAIIATFYDIKNKDSRWTLKIAKLLLYDKHDLIHKAVGWMLREVGKRCHENILLDFLNKNYPAMPRTMLRYAIERLSEKQRKHYLKRT